MTHGVAIVGAGLIGKKRAAALRQFENCRLQVVADINKEAAEGLAHESGAQAETDWQRVVCRDDVDIVVVSTVNGVLREVSTGALRNRKHVLCEKPLGRNSVESQAMVDAADEAGVVLKTGFNHRCHPAIAKAKELLDAGQIGSVMFLRCRYGHGGRPGYEKEWRASKQMCGGGEMLDQGVHVVDLFRWFASEFDEAFGYAPTCFWPMEVEDNAFAMFRSQQGIVATMHTSWTQWKNLFSFEVFGTGGYLIIDGLGGSYGIETLRIGRRKPEGGVPDEQIVQFNGPDMSWQSEWQEFLRAIDQNREPIGSGHDGHQANRMIEAVYRSARENRVVAI
jgi:predicted dehydrogenase